MRYSFEVVTSRNCLGSFEVELNEQEVQTIKSMFAEEGDFNLGWLEDYDEDLFNKILDLSNKVAEEGIKQIYKENAEACGEAFDEANFQVDWSNENVETICTDDFFLNDKNNP